MTVGGLFSPVLRVLRCVVASRLDWRRVLRDNSRRPEWEYYFGLTESEYSSSQVTGSTILPSRGFRIINLRVQSDGMFVVSVKPEVVVSQPEVVLRDRKWLPSAQVQRL